MLSMKNRIKGRVIAIWDNGNILDSEATLDESTGELYIAPTIDDEYDIDFGVIEEYFESEDGEIRYEVCKQCHDAIVYNDNYCKSCYINH